MNEHSEEQSSRRDRERERHRREILHAAERIFIAKGFEATTIEEIAKEAQFAVGTLYLFFKGKEELYGCVIQRIAHDFMEQFQSRVLTQKNPEDALATLIELRLTHFDNHRAFFRLVFASPADGRIDLARALPPQCRQVHDRYIADVTKLFQQGISEGIFDAVDPLYLTLSLEGIIKALFAYWSQHPPTEPLTQNIATLQRQFLGRAKIHLGKSV